MGGRSEAAIAAGDLFAWVVRDAAEGEMRAAARCRLQKDELDRAELGAKAIESRGGDGGGNQKRHGAFVHDTRLGGGGPKLSVHFHQARKWLPGSANELLAAVKEHFEAGELNLACANQRCDSRVAEQSWGDGAILRCLELEFIRDGVCVCFHADGLLVEMIAEKVRTELQIQEVRGGAGHREQQHNRNDSDENVGDDEAVAQAP